jgi:hypothetical protein
MDWLKRLKLQIVNEFSISTPLEQLYLCFTIFVTVFFLIPVLAFLGFSVLFTIAFGLIKLLTFL